MRKILYLTTWDFVNEKADGVCKKIKSQIDVFRENGFQVDFIYVRSNSLIAEVDGIKNNLGRLGNIKKTPAYIKMYPFLKNKRYDFVYNRFGMFDTFYCRILSCLKKNGAKIMLEVPSYPYKGEKRQGFLNGVMFVWDDICSLRVKRYIDIIYTFSSDKYLWGVPCIQIRNGIDISQYPLKRYENLNHDSIELVSVALMQPYHGYERIIEGMYQYYKNGGTRDIRLHLIGDGSEKSYYEKMTSELELSEHVVFHGLMSIQEMTEIFDEADIGVCSLGLYKKGASISSELKSKEFMARGIPFIYASDLDIEEYLDSNISRKFSNDGSTIDICEIVEFYDSIKGGYKEYSKSMRENVTEHISMQSAMKPMLDFVMDN